MSLRSPVGILCVIASCVLIYALYSFETARLAATNNPTGSIQDGSFASDTEDSRHEPIIPGSGERLLKDRPELDSDQNRGSGGDMDILTQAHLSMEKLILELNESRTGGPGVVDVEVHQAANGDFGGGGKPAGKVGVDKRDEEKEEENPLSNVDFLGAQVSDAIAERSKTVKFEDYKETVMGVNLFRYEANPPPGVTLLGSVLLLHGQAFSSQNWLDIQTPHILAAGGYKVVAVDLPGYGKTGGNSVPVGQRAALIAAIITAAGLDHPILVSPSMSGSYALPVLVHRPELISGYVPVAPVGTGEYSLEEYQRTKVPTLIVYGDRDTSLGTMSVSNLRALPFSHILKVPNAGHAAYLNQKEVWNAALLKFCNVIFHK